MTSTRTTLLIRDLVMDCQIGVYPSERGRGQRVRVSLEIDIDLPPPEADSIGEVLSYERFVTETKRLGAAGHINLVETLAERVATMALATPNVLAARVSVEKLDVYADVGSVGVRIERSKF
jgi:dihydroneopterin aldolase